MIQLARQLVPFGDTAQGVTSKRAQATLAVLGQARGFELVELRSVVLDGAPADAIVVDSINPEVPTRNSIGIKTRECLALVFPHDESQAPSVRALRADFPIVMHLNHVPRGEPASLCLYQEPWSATERTWTPQKHLQRILWWMRETSRGTLHLREQPVEQFYFESPFELVLPPDWSQGLSDAQGTLVLQALSPSGSKSKVVIRAGFVKREEALSMAQQPWAIVPVSVRPATHGRVYEFPETIGELERQLQDRGSTDFLHALRQSVAAHDAGQGVRLNQDQRCILLLSVPVQRESEQPAEATTSYAFLAPVPLAQLGKRLGALQDINGGAGPYFKVGEVLPGGNAAELDWQGIQVSPLSVRFANDAARAREMAGLQATGAEFAGVLAGCGALGSLLVDTWSREAWGTWTLVDPDYLAAHNVARHLGRDVDIGRSKAHVVKRLVDGIYQGDYRRVNAVVAGALDKDGAAAIEQAGFLVDVSTTLEVPRELAAREKAPRCASVFITPSGRASVLLLEDASRATRLDSLEAQYYRAILNEAWGAEHLAGHSGELWVGAGCRDVSLVISHGTIQLHAGILSRQLRLARDVSAARLRVWAVDDEGGVDAINVVVEDPMEARSGAWRVLWDKGTARKLKTLRHAALPAETGGIVLGFTDHKTSTIAVVDVLPAPADSVGHATGFERGSEGLLEAVRTIAKQTGNVVGYIGEWHSHPMLVRPLPSSDDKRQLAYLIEALERDGEPALMVIVGSDGEVTLTVGSATE